MQLSFLPFISKSCGLHRLLRLDLRTVPFLFSNSLFFGEMTFYVPVGAVSVRSCTRLRGHILIGFGMFKTLFLPLSLCQNATFVLRAPRMPLVKYFWCNCEK